MTPQKPFRASSPTVLALMIHPGYSGYAALNGYGDHVIGTTYLSRRPRDCASMLVRLIQRLVERVRPQRVVLGISPRDATRVGSLRVCVRRLCKQLRLDVVTRPIGDAFKRLGVTTRFRSRNGFARYLIDHFVPDLFHRYTTRLARIWKRRPAWHALALTVSELVDLSPLSAAALVPASGHRIPSFTRALQHALSAV